MNVNRAPPPADRKKAVQATAATGASLSRLSFYEKAPTDEITIEEFESWAIDRLRVLAEIEACLVRNRKWEELKEIVGQRTQQYLRLDTSGLPAVDLDAQRRKDYVSHFVLRLAFCRSEELRAKFIKAEQTLFKIRWEQESAADQYNFMRELKLDMKPVSTDEKNAWKSQLIASSFGVTADNFDAEAFFKVNWTKVADLVSQRRVFLAGGQAFVPMKDQFSLILQEFTLRLTQSLENTSRALPRLDEDDRLVPVLEHLSMAFLAGVTSQYTVKPESEGESITADMVDDLARHHFPACMRNLHDNLRRNKHLKHYGRLQYNLFLKGIGMSVEEALLFWRRGFSSMSDDKFNKEYKYNIRHGYGLEGQRKNYPPKNCQRIITSDQPGSQDNHGCPFRHFSEQTLSSLLLSSYRISNPQETKEIMEAVKGGHYHVACTRVFEITHKDFGVKKGDGVGQGESVSHPNLYFEKSRAFARAKAIQAIEVDA